MEEMDLLRARVRELEEWCEGWKGRACRAEKQLAELGHPTELANCIRAGGERCTHHEMHPMDTHGPCDSLPKGYPSHGR